MFHGGLRSDHWSREWNLEESWRPTGQLSSEGRGSDASRERGKRVLKAREKVGAGEMGVVQKGRRVGELSEKKGVGRRGEDVVWMAAWAGREHGAWTWAWA